MCLKILSVALTLTKDNSKQEPSILRMPHPQDSCEQMVFAEDSVNIFGLQSHLFINHHWKKWPSGTGEVVLSVLGDEW